MRGNINLCFEEEIFFKIPWRAGGDGWRTKKGKMFSGIPRPYASQNLRATSEEVRAITRSLLDGVDKGWLSGPHKTPPFETCWTTGLGAVPKDGSKFRTISHSNMSDSCSRFYYF